MSNRTSAFAVSSTRRGCSAYEIYQESSNYSTVVLRKSVEPEECNAKNTFTAWIPHRWASHVSDTFGSFLVFCVYDTGAMEPIGRIS